MAWIELHDNLPDHPKVLDLAAALKMDKDMVVGKLVRLWTWALANREDGVFAERDIGTVAEVMRFKGKPERLISALVDTRLLDRDGESYAIHDWEDRVGMLLAKRETIREQSRLRKRKQRDKEKVVTRDISVTDGNVTPESHASHAVTVPKPYLNQNHTVEDTPLNPPAGGGDAKLPVKKLTAAQEAERLDEACLLPPVREAVERWLAYKRERGQGYKPTGFDTLLKTIQEKATQCGPDAVCAVIGESISNNYQGITWDRVKPAVQPKHGRNRYSNLERLYHEMEDKDDDES
jgi:hypothetical protein